MGKQWGFEEMSSKSPKHGNRANKMLLFIRVFLASMSLILERVENISKKEKKKIYEIKLI